jgi:hypothetical protein
VCSDVSLKPVSVAVLVVTAPVNEESNSSWSWFCSDAQGEELFMRGGEITSLRITAIGERREESNLNGVAEWVWCERTKISMDVGPSPGARPFHYSSQLATLSWGKKQLFE